MKVLFYLLLMLTSSCQKFPPGKIDAGIDKLKECLSIRNKDKNLMQQRNCFCSDLSKDQLIRYQRILGQISNDRKDDLDILFPESSLNRTVSERLKLNVGGISVGMLYIEQSWCIKSVFYK